MNYNQGFQNRQSNILDSQLADSSILHRPLSCEVDERLCHTVKIYSF